MRPLLLLLLLACSFPAPARELVVMTYNLRFASVRPPNAWPDRQPIMRDLLREVNPDVIGTQEGVFPQLKDLAADLREHDWIGLGRDGGSRGEFMAVFYRRERLEPVEFDHFWLSDTPDVIGSSTWGNTNRRMVTWVKFRDRLTDREFYLWNTHLDHALQPAREQAAALIRRRVDALKTDLPVILLGDFNAAAGKNPAFTTLTGDGFFRDTWDLAGERRNADYNTFSGFAPAKRDGERIDWILLRGAADVRATEINVFSRDGQYPSDHFPVVAWLTLRGPAGP